MEMEKIRGKPLHYVQRQEYDYDYYQNLYIYQVIWTAHLWYIHSFTDLQNIIMEKKYVLVKTRRATTALSMANFVG